MPMRKCERCGGTGETAEGYYDPLIGCSVLGACPTCSGSGATFTPETKQEEHYVTRVPEGSRGEPEPEK